MRMQANIFLNLLKEKFVIPVLKEEGPFIIAPVVDVVKATFGELHSVKILDWS